MKKISMMLIIIVWCIGTAVYAADLTSTHFIVRDPVVGTGGGYQSSTNFGMYSAGNLNISGDAGTSTNYQMRDGVLQYPTVIPGTLVATPSGSTVAMSWPASSVFGGYTVSSYNIGVATVSGGPYTFTSVPTSACTPTCAYSYINQLPGRYYYIAQTLDAFGNVIATSNEATAVVQETVSFSLSANTLSFGPLTTAGPRYANTTSGTGTFSSGSPAHTITASSNASSGYTINYIGETLSSGAATINPATISGSSTGTAGTNQFALSLLASGTATIPTSYDETAQNWKFAASTLSAIASTSGPAAAATLNAYYLANVATLAPAGTYNATISYEITANY